MTRTHELAFEVEQKYSICKATAEVKLICSKIRELLHFNFQLRYLFKKTVRIVADPFVVPVYI